MNIDYNAIFNSILILFLSVRLVIKKKIDVVYSILFVLESFFLFFISLYKEKMFMRLEQFKIEYQNIMFLIISNTYLAIYLIYKFTESKKVNSILVQEIALLQKRIDRVELTNEE